MASSAIDPSCRSIQGGLISLSYYFYLCMHTLKVHWTYNTVVGATIDLEVVFIHTHTTSEREIVNECDALEFYYVDCYPM